MISPYVRRRRLANEIVRLREEHGYSADKLAKAIGVARQRISRLENGHVRPDLNEIMKILDTLRVGERRWSNVITIAREAQERGWWESYAEEMGTRQSLYANLEAGAATIREYQQSFVPGLLQTPEFTLARIEVDKATGPLSFDPARAIEARAGRQRMLRRPGGPTYAAIIDEVVVRRLPVPPDVMWRQLVGLVEASAASDKLSIRVLPVEARVAGFRMPRSAFSLYTYSDPGDPVVATVDTVTSDLVLVDHDQVSPYVEMYGRLCEATLTPGESREFLKQAAARLANELERAS
ncbi:MAG: helix-turn-helix domain-containing protein [Micromonosporaceae bacterium]